MFATEREYLDWDGQSRKETFRFNLTPAELTEMQMSVKGGLKAVVEKAMEEQDGPKIFELFKTILFKSYGEKSVDGRRFEKSPELSKAFSETQAYVDIFMDLVTQENFAKTFIEKTFPTEEEMKKYEKMKDAAKA